MIRISASVFKEKLFPKHSDINMDRFVEKYGEEHAKFKHYKYAIYATDVMFTQTLKPSGLFPDKKPFFSGKHHLHGLKSEVSVNAFGEAVYVAPPEIGSVHDKHIFMNNIKFHKKVTQKTADQRVAVDHGEGSSRHQNRWGILLDKAYIGVEEHVRGIIPKKKPRAPYNLTREEFERNVRVSSDRVIVENYFGRCCFPAERCFGQCVSGWKGFQAVIFSAGTMWQKIFTIKKCTWLKKLR